MKVTITLPNNQTVIAEVENTNDVTLLQELLNFSAPIQTNVTPVRTIIKKSMSIQVPPQPSLRRRKLEAENRIPIEEIIDNIQHVLSKLPTKFTIKRVYKQLFGKEINAIEDDTINYQRIYKALKQMYIAKQLKRINTKTYINPTTPIPMQVHPTVTKSPEVSIVAMKPEQPTKFYKKTEEPVRNLVPNVLARISNEFTFKEFYKEAYGEDMTSGSTNTKVGYTKYMRLYQTLRRNVKTGVLTSERVGDDIQYKKTGNLPVEPEPPKKKREYTKKAPIISILYEDIPILEPAISEKILSEYTSISPSTFTEFVSREGQRIDERLSKFIFDWLTQHLMDITKLTGKNWQLTGWGQYKTLEVK